jgi:hypothetical protein
MAYNLATKRFWESQRHGPKQRPLQLFISLDMNVLPHATLEDAYALADKIQPLLLSPAQMKRNGQPIVSTFSGEYAFGRDGWKHFLEYLNDKLTKDHVFFWPAFFTVSKYFIANPVAHGVFAWNSAW